MRPAGLGIAAAAALAVVLLGVVVVRAGSPLAGEFTGTAYDPPMAAPHFELTDHRGRSVTLEDYRGKALLVFFGFTNCPDVCPLTLRKLARVLSSMRADTADVGILLVTVDPERDTPEVLARYVSGFAPYVTGLTGDTASLASLRGELGVFAGTHPAEHGTVITHTPAVFGIDRRGDVRVLLPMEREDAVVARDIRRLIGVVPAPGR